MTNNNKFKKSFNKNSNSIEISLGDKITKYDIMKVVAQKYNIYEATVWLSTPISSLGNKTPAELMSNGEFKDLSKLISEINEKPL